MRLPSATATSRLHVALHFCATICSRNSLGIELVPAANRSANELAAVTRPIFYADKLALVENSFFCLMGYIPSAEDLN
jgi:hypothetical protein